MLSLRAAGSTETEVRKKFTRPLREERYGTKLRKLSYKRPLPLVTAPLNWLDVGEHYSYLRASMGSIRLARRAGIKPASEATKKRRMMESPATHGSCALTPNS